VNVGTHVAALEARGIVGGGAARRQRIDLAGL